MKQNLDLIFFEQLRCEAIIGVYPEEQFVPQELSLDLKLYTDFAAAAKSDDLADTIDYAQLAIYVQNLCKNTHFALLESLAEHLAQNILQKFPINKICLKISKPKILANAQAVGVCITRYAQSN